MGRLTRNPVVLYLLPGSRVRLRISPNSISHGAKSSALSAHRSSEAVECWYLESDLGTVVQPKNTPTSSEPTCR